MFGRALAAAVLLTPIPFAGAAQAAPAITMGGYMVTIEGTLTAYSGSYLGHRYVHNQLFSHKFSIPLGNHNTQNWYISTCAGGDTVARAQFKVRRISGNPEISTIFSLHTGSSCIRSENTLKGQKIIPYTQLDPQPRNLYAGAKSYTIAPDAGSVDYKASSKFRLCCFSEK